MEESLIKEITYVLNRDKSEKFLKAVLSRALILEELMQEDDKQ